MPTARSDDDLIARCLRGDDDAWRELVVRYRRLIYSIPVAFGVADPDEVFQTVAVRLFENLAKIRRGGSLAAWLATTTRRECIAVSNRARRAVPIEDRETNEPSEEPADVAQALLDIEREHTLHLALERLDGTCRDLLTALYLEEPTPSYKEISARLGRPVGSLGPTRGRCLDKLLELYRELGGKTPDGVSAGGEAPPVE